MFLFRYDGIKKKMYLYIMKYGSKYMYDTNNLIHKLLPSASFRLSFHAT